MTAKKFTLLIVTSFLFFIAYHFTVWQLYTSQIFKPKEGTSVGDLGRMSYQISMLNNRKLEYTLIKKHLNKTNYKNQPIDILTIGDSFSNGDALGENPYYQDFLATKFNLNILNISKSKTYNSLETIIGLYNNGTLTKLHPKSIIIESIERLVLDRYAKDLDFSITDVNETIAPLQTKIPTIDIDFINTANYKIPYYSFLYLFKQHAQKYVYKFSLNKNLFSINGGKKILIFRDDLRCINKSTKKNIQKINNNFNKLAVLLQNLNIKLYFMPVVDKYDLYYPYIKSNKHPNNDFFNLIRPLEKKYTLIDTKKILSPLLENNVKDLYWVDDTHWTQKASKEISKNIKLNLIRYNITKVQ